MSDTVIQQNVTSGWEAKPFGSIGILTMGQSPKGSSYSINKVGLPLLNGAVDLRKDRIEINQYTSAPVRTSKEGDLLFCIRATIGNLQVSNRVYCLGRGVASIRVDEKYDRNFVAQKLEELFVLMRKRSQGGVIKGLTKDELAEFEILVPKSKSEQQKIAEILGTVDENIAKTQGVIEATEKLKRGLMQQLFTRGIGHTKFKETKIGQIPEGWDFGGFKNLVNPDDKNAIKPGPFGSALKKNFYVEKGFKIYGQEQVISGDAFYGDYYVNEEKYKELEGFKVNAGDILISLVGTIGKILIVPGNFEKGIINPRLLKITPDSTKADSQFIAHLLKSDYLIQQMSQKSHGGTMNILNKGMLMSVGFGVPPLKEQKEIAEILSAVDEKISVNKKLKEKFTLLKKGLMQDLLSGKVRVQI